MNDQAFTFQTLHPDTIMDALFEQGIRVDSGLTALNSYENRVYQFQDEERQRFVVKFYRPQRWSAEQIQEEHQFAHDLLDDDVPVAAPIKFNNQTLLTHQGFYYAVFPSLGGRQFEADNIDQMEWVARYLGRIHQTGRKKPFVARPTIGVKEYLIEPRQVFETSALIPNALKDNFLTATDKLIDAVKAAGGMILLLCACTVTATPGIFSGAMVRYLSILMTHVWDPRCRICGCYSTVIKPSSACSLRP